MTALLLALVIIAVCACVEAWLVMVLWGALALTFGFVTIGFGTAFLVCLALNVAGSLLKGAFR